MRQRVERNDRLPAIRHVAGVDVGYEAGGRVTRAAVAVLAYPGLQLVETSVARCPTAFPYVPGLTRRILRYALYVNSKQLGAISDRPLI